MPLGMEWNPNERYCPPGARTAGRTWRRAVARHLAYVAAALLDQHSDDYACGRLSLEPWRDAWRFDGRGNCHPRRARVSLSTGSPLAYDRAQLFRARSQVS